MWNIENGRRLRTVMHPAITGDVFVGAPRTGRTVAERPYAVYVVEDGVELLWLDDPAGNEEPIRLLLPFTAGDIATEDGVVFVAGGAVS